MHYEKNPLFYLFFIFLTLFLSGCGSIPGPALKSNHKAFSTTSKQSSDSVAYYLSAAKKTSGIESDTYLLKAAKILVSSEKLAEAENLLNQVHSSDTKLLTLKRILGAEILLKKGSHYAALSALKKVWQPNSLDFSVQQDFYRIRSWANFLNGHLFSATEDSLKIPNNEKQTLEILMQANLKALQLFKNQSSHNRLLQGWIEFVYLTKTHSANRQYYDYALLQWQNRHPNHPANTLLKNLPKTPFQDASLSPQKIALLLPNESPHQKSAQIIRDGFLANYYTLNKNRVPIHTLRFYHTGQGEQAISAYYEALREGVDLIIGPLTKQGVEAIASLGKLKVPVLALNTLPKLKKLPTNLFLFNLAPEHEVAAICEKARKAQLKEALVIVPKNAWGERMARAFQTHWPLVGGNVLGIEFFGAPKNHARKMRTLLEISASEQRAQKIQKLLKEKMVFKPTRRKDPDLIFMATPPEMARQLKPLLNFYYAGDLPVYATSHIYGGTHAPEKDKDLNHVIFCNMPWLLEQSPKITEIRTKLGQLWPKSFEHSPELFAFGMDVYTLSHHLFRLSHFSETSLQGMTGLLSIDAKHFVTRQPSFAKIENGKPKLIS